MDCCQPIVTSYIFLGLTPFIKLYDTDGKCVGRRSFEEQTETDLKSSQHIAEENEEWKKGNHMHLKWNNVWLKLCTWIH